MKICLGGTFNIIHKGHRKLIHTALSVAGSDGFVFIGVAIGNLVKHKMGVKSFEERKNQLVSFLSDHIDLPTVVIEPISDIYGPTLKQDFNGIVVSHESVHNARLINIEREKRHLPVLKIIEIPFVMADDGKPISNTRIQSGEITKEGKIISNDYID